MSRITYIPSNLVCCDGRFHGDRKPQQGHYIPRIQWQRTADAQDMRPTFAEAINAYCAAHGVTIADLCRGVTDVNHVYCIRRCEHVPTPEVRQRLAALITMQPADIRWPVPVREEK